MKLSVMVEGQIYDAHELFRRTMERDHPGVLDSLTPEEYAEDVNDAKLVELFQGLGFTVLWQADETKEISSEEFANLEPKRSAERWIDSQDYQIVKSLELGKIALLDHPNCNQARATAHNCPLAALAYRTAQAKGWRASVIHTKDGKLAVSYQERGG